LAGWTAILRKLPVFSTVTPLRGTCSQIFRVVGMRPLRIIQ
jgi:hypothetical protein